MENFNPCEKIDEAIESFLFRQTILQKKEFGNGHINNTYLLVAQKSGEEPQKYVLQRVNHNVFKQPMQVMENVIAVTSFLKKKISENGGCVARETINYLPDAQGSYCFKDSIGSYWRCYNFIEDAVTYDTVRKPEDFYQSAVAFGHFQYLLSDFPADKLIETIPDFHNTPVRFEAFKKAVSEDICHRAVSVQKEIDFVMQREAFMHLLTDALQAKKIPMRVTHNDTKLNNVLFDTVTDKAMCVIDLDTVMPGLSVYDFGDSIRFGATTGAEDEPDLSKVNFDLGLFASYTEGYLEGCKGSLTAEEKKMMPVGAKMMTLECGMRFLTDYLQGDTYFRIQRENHNLDRCRTQFKLVADMEAHWSEMEAIVAKF